MAKKTKEENTNKEDLKSRFQKFKEKIGNAIQDAASLEITTFTGNFTFKTSQIVKSGVEKFEINDVLKNMSVQNDTDIKLIAYTFIHIDADVKTIVKSDLSESDAELLKLHTEMLKSSREARKATINMIKDLF